MSSFYASISAPFWLHDHCYFWVKMFGVYNFVIKIFDANTLAFHRVKLYLSLRRGNIVKNSSYVFLAEIGKVFLAKLLITKVFSNNNSIATYTTVVKQRKKWAFRKKHIKRCSRSFFQRPLSNDHLFVIIAWSWDILKARSFVKAMKNKNGLA